MHSLFYLNIHTVLMLLPGSHKAFVLWKELGPSFVQNIVSRKERAHINDILIWTNVNASPLMTKFLLNCWSQFMMNDYKILGIPQPKYSHVFLNNVIFMSTLFTVVGSRHLVFLQSSCFNNSSNLRKSRFWKACSKYAITRVEDRN